MFARLCFLTCSEKTGITLCKHVCLHLCVLHSDRDGEKVCACVCVYMCVCALLMHSEREREREREGG